MQAVGHALAPREVKLATSRIAGPNFDAFWDLCEEPGDSEEAPGGSRRGSLQEPLPEPPRAGEGAGREAGRRRNGGARQPSSGSRPPLPPAAAGNSRSADPVPAAPPRGQQREAVGSAVQSQAGSSPAASARSARGPEDQLPPPPRAVQPGHGAPSFHRMHGDHDPEPQSPPLADLQTLASEEEAQARWRSGGGASGVPRLPLQSAARAEDSPPSLDVDDNAETVSQVSSFVSRDGVLPAGPAAARDPAQRAGGGLTV